MKKGERTKRYIVEQAASVFNVQGYSASSISTVMAATGLKKGGIYRHFKNKDELIVESFAYTYDIFQAELLAALRGKRDAVSRLKTLGATTASHYDHAVLPGGCPILNAAVESTDSSPLLREKVREAMQDWRELIIMVVNSGIKRGELKVDTKPEIVASILISLTEGALMVSRLEENPEYMETALDHLYSYIDGLAVG